MIDADTYLLAISHNMHLNPFMAGIVPEVVAYPWSSYPAYRRPQAAYRAFVEQGLDDEIDQFYHRSHHPPIPGNAAFEASVAENRKVDAEILGRVRQWHVPSFEEIIATTAAAFSVASESLLTSRRGRGQGNPARQVALYLSREVGGYSLAQIAAYLGLGHDASVSRSAQLVGERLESESALAQIIENLDAQLVNG